MEQELLELGRRDRRRPRERRQRVCESASSDGGGRGFPFRSSKGLERRPVVGIEAERDVEGRGREPEGADDASAASREEEGNVFFFFESSRGEAMSFYPLLF